MPKYNTYMKMLVPVTYTVVGEDVKTVPDKVVEITREAYEKWKDVYTEQGCKIIEQ